MAGPWLRKGAISAKGAKPGIEIRHKNERGAKPGIAKKMESTGGTIGRRATAAFWFKAKANISAESVVRSYACERNVPVEVQDRLVPESYSLALWNLV